MKTEILKSTYIQRFLLAVVVLTAAVCILASVFSKDMSIPSEAIYQALEGKADILFEFGSYDSIEILNGEKGYFAVSDDGIEKVVNRDGEVLLDIGMNAYEKVRCGDYYFLDGIRLMLVNCQTLELTEYPLGLPQLHPSGKYLLGSHDDGLWKVICTEDGKVIYESQEKLKWTQKEGCVVEQPENGPERIVNLKTGKVEFTAEKGQEIEDGNDDFWLIQDDNCQFVLDAAYQMHSNWPLFRRASLGDGVVIGTAIEGASAADIKEYRHDGIFAEPDVRVFNQNGEEVYWLDPINIHYLGNVGNTLVLQNMQDDSFIYRTVGPDGLEEEIISPDYYIYPSDDQFAPAYQMAYSGQDPMKPSAEPIMSESMEYRWTFVNKNMEPLTECVLYGAGIPENGYAVIRDEKWQWALIDLRQRGES